MLTYEIKKGEIPIGRCLERSWATAAFRARRWFGQDVEVKPVYHDGQIQTIDELVDAENGLTLQRIRGIG